MAIPSRGPPTLGPKPSGAVTRPGRTRTTSRPVRARGRPILSHGGVLEPLQGTPVQTSPAVFCRLADLQLPDPAILESEVAIRQIIDEAFSRAPCKRAFGDRPLLSFCGRSRPSPWQVVKIGRAQRNCRLWWTAAASVPSSEHATDKESRWRQAATLGLLIDNAVHGRTLINRNRGALPLLWQRSTWCIWGGGRPMLNLRGGDPLRTETSSGYLSGREKILPRARSWNDPNRRIVTDSAAGRVERRAPRRRRGRRVQSGSPADTQQDVSTPRLGSRSRSESHNP